MKPAFALSLSFEGISLLHRAAGGWRSVGEVALDVPDLAAALSDLRDKALLLEPGGLACKLIIPNDQIRYLTLETGRAEGEARRALVRKALDGATPYAVEELAFDISVEGDVTHVAAVARETLAEAESFAVEHRFNPVSFAAIPGDQPFLGEPFFGAAANAQGAEVEPDGIAVVVTGPAAIPDPAAEAPAPDEAEPEAANAAVPRKPDGKAKSDAKTEAKGEGDADAKPQAAPEETPEKSAEQTTDEPAEKPTDPVPPAVGFSSRRGKEDGAVPTLTGASRDDVPGDTTPAPSLAAPAQAEADSTAAKPVTAPAATKPPKTSKPSKPSGKAARKPAGDKPGKPEKPARGASVRARAAGLLGRRTAAAAPEQGKPGDKTGKPAQPAAHPIAQPPAAQSFTSTRPEALQDEAERMTVFGARQGQVGGKPRHLGLILTVILLLFLAAVAGWAALFTEGGIAGLFSAPEERQEIAADPEPAPDRDNTAESEAPTTPAPQTAPAPAQPPLTSALSPQPPSEQADDAAALPADDAETVAEEAPARAEAPAGPDPAGALTDTDTAVLDALRQDPGIEQPAPLDPTDEDIAALDPELAAEPEPDLAPELEPEPETTGDPADTETFYAATGIWPAAPDEPETPSIIGLDDLYVASIDRTDLSQDAVALPPAGGFATDASLNAVTSPAAAGTAFALDDRGLVDPTPEGAVTPDGITVYLGRPPVVPPATPNRRTTADEAVAEAEALRTRLAGFRPRPRPGDLVEQTERAQLGGRSRNELGQLRPRVRPASAQDDAAGAAPSGAPATAQAVARALIPRARPGNFQETVRKSERASIGVPQNLSASAPAPAATVSPKIPTSASVARQATLKNEINLRRVNLIGVYGSAGNRRALVRLPSGRYKKVQVGDRIDGGKVVAIGEDRLQYQKGGSNHTLKMPKG